jgi:hypothetical protein
LLRRNKDVGGRAKPGHDDEQYANVSA